MAVEEHAPAVGVVQPQVHVAAVLVAHAEEGIGAAGLEVDRQQLVLVIAETALVHFIDHLVPAIGEVRAVLADLAPDDALPLVLSGEPGWGGQRGGEKDGNGDAGHVLLLLCVGGHLGGRCCAAAVRAPVWRNPCRRDSSRYLPMLETVTPSVETPSRLGKTCNLPRCAPL